MRAQFIRGEDPKEQMGIGNKIVQLEKRMERAARIICRDYDLDLNTLTTWKDDRGMGVEFDGKQPNILYPYRYWIFYDFEREHFWAGYTYIPKDEIADQMPKNSLEEAMLQTRIYLNKFNWHAKGVVKEAVNFERGMDPKDSMSIGDVEGRKMKKAREEIYNGIKKIAIEHWGGEAWELKDNPYMRIKEKRSKNEYLEIGIEYTPEGPKGSIYYSYVVFVPDPDKDLTEWAAGYNIERKFRLPQSPNARPNEDDEIPYDNLEDALGKMEYWLKNF